MATSSPADPRQVAQSRTGSRPGLASVSRSTEILRSRRRVAIGGALLTALSTLAAAWVFLVPGPGILRSLFHGVLLLFGDGLLGAPAVWLTAIGVACLPALVALPIGAMARRRVREASRGGRDMGRAAAAGITMGALVAGLTAVLLSSVALASSASTAVSLMCLALGVGVVGAMAQSAVPPGRAQEESVPPMVSFLLGCGVQGPVLLAGTGALLAGCWAMGKLTGATILGFLPWAFQPLAACTGMMLALTPLTWLGARLLSTRLPGSSRGTLALGMTLPALVPLLLAGRALFRAPELLALVPVIYGAAGTLIAGSHALAAWKGAIPARRSREAITDHGSQQAPSGFESFGSDPVF